MLLFEFPFLLYRKVAAHRLFWLGVPLALYSWTITGPFLSDDLHLILQSERYIHGESKGLELFRFAKFDDDWRQLRDRGTCPWWVSPIGRLDFFRPVTELSFFLDVLLFGRNPLGYRLVSLAVFAVALLCVHRLMIIAGGDAVRVGTATCYYGVSQTVAPPVTWMCNRQDLLVVIGVTLAAAAYWEAGHQPKARHFWIAVAAFSFALLSKEVAVALAAVVCLHEIVVRRRPDARPGRRQAGQIAVVILLVAIGYLFYYVYSRPWAFLVNGADGSPTQLGSSLPRSLLLYSAVWTIGFPIDLLHAATEPQVLAVGGVGGAMMLLAIFYLRRTTHQDSAALFFTFWAIFFIVPGLRALTASSRTLCTATVGWSYLLVSLFFPEKSGAVVPLPLRAWLNAANGVFSAGCAIGTVLFMNAAEIHARERLQAAVAASPSPLRDGDTLIFDRAESALEMMCAGERLEFLTGRKNVSAIFLLGPDVDATVSSVDDRTLVARAKEGGLFESSIHRLTLGAEKRHAVGDRYEIRPFVAEVADVDKENRVRTLQFHFREPLTSPDLHFFPPHPASAAPAVGSGAER